MNDEWTIEDPTGLRLPRDLRAVDLGGSSPAGLAHWVAETSVDQTIRSRARIRSLSRQASDEATFAGMLVDLAERGDVISITTLWGRRRHGRIDRVGADHIEMTRSSRRTLLRLAAIGHIDLKGPKAPPTGRRARPTAPSMIETFRTLSIERPAISVVGPNGARSISGELCDVGADFVSVTPDGNRRPSVFIAVERIAEATIDG